MDLSVIAYLLLLTLVAFERLAELQISRGHQQQLARRGIAKHPDPQFSWMVALHAGVLAGAILEVIAFRRPFVPAMGASMGLLLVLATALRWWAIRALGAHWNVEVMASGPLGVITSGPFHWVRHPNYLAVWVEMAALPLIHTAWITALVATAGNTWILRHRLRIEEPVLDSDPTYRATMVRKPRFLPRLF